MSRIGRLAISVPTGVTVSCENNLVTVKGPRGILTQEIDPKIALIVDGKTVHLTRSSEEKEIKAKHGLYRSLVNNMVTGVTKGFEKGLIVTGVGYKVTKQANKATFNLGYSHPITITEPAGVTIDVLTPTELTVKGNDKTVVGQCAADIKSLRKPDPYHGYGIRYKNETILRKEGKTAGK